MVVADAAVAAAAAHPLAAAGASLLTFWCLNQLMRTVLHPHAEQLFGRPGNPGRAVEQLGVFVNHATTMVHVVVTGLCVGHMFFYEDGLGLLYTNPLYGELRLMPFLFPFSFGYVCYDTLDLFRTYRSKARSSPPHWCAPAVHATAQLDAAAIISLSRVHTADNQDARPSRGVALRWAILVRGWQRPCRRRLFCWTLRRAATDYGALYE